MKIKNVFVIRREVFKYSILPNCNTFPRHFTTDKSRLLVYVPIYFYNIPILRDGSVFDWAVLGNRARCLSHPIVHGHRFATPTHKFRCYLRNATELFKCTTSQKIINVKCPMRTMTMTTLQFNLDFNQNTYKPTTPKSELVTVIQPS